MKRIVLGVAALIIAVATSVSLFAQPPQGFGRGLGRGMGPGMGPGPFGMLERLNLTDDQRTQIKALLDERKNAGPNQKRMDLQRQLHDAIYADTPDTAKIDELKAAIKEADAEAFDAQVALQLKIAQILTPEQRQQAREFEGRRGRGRR